MGGKHIIFCNCSFSDVVPAETKRAVLAAIEHSGINFTVVPDLCEMAENRDPELGRLSKGGGVTIVACHPRAVRCLFIFGGAPLPETGVQMLNMRTQSADEIIAQLPREASGQNQSALSRPLADNQVALTEQRPPSPGADELEGCAPSQPQLIEERKSHRQDKNLTVSGAKEPGDKEATQHDWVPWFPVIDYGRCKNCKQCLSFCLFGVYGTDGNGKVAVKNPRNCKTNCPACARICPEVAIVFPKCPESPINGADIENEELARANVKVNLEKVLGNDPYAALAERRKRAKMRLSK